MAIENTQNVVEIIQLALTPVFLLVGIGTILNVVTGRVARVIDRARWFESAIFSNKLPLTPRNAKELRSLDKRLKMANWSINFLTAAAVIVCFDIILLMLSGLVNYDMGGILMIMFMLSLLFITGGLAAFLMEVSVATATLKIPKRIKVAPEETL